MADIDRVTSPDPNAAIFKHGAPRTDPNARIGFVQRPDPTARIYLGQQAHPALVAAIQRERRAAVEANEDPKLARAVVVDIHFQFGAPGTALTTGAHCFLRLGLNRPLEVVGWSLGATVAGAATSGAVTVDVQAGSTLASLGTICGTAKPALAAQSELTDQAIPAGWAPRIPDAVWLYATVTAADGTLEVVSLTLRCRKVA